MPNPLATLPLEAAVELAFATMDDIEQQYPEADSFDILEAQVRTMCESYRFDVAQQIYLEVFGATEAEIHDVLTDACHAAGVDPALAFWSLWGCRLLLTEPNGGETP